jgi:hypothetical protein
MFTDRLRVMGSDVKGAIALIDAKTSTDELHFQVHRFFTTSFRNEESDKLKLSKTTLQNLRSGKRAPGPETIEVLHAFFSIGPIKYRKIKRRGLGRLATTEDDWFHDAFMTQFMSPEKNECYEDLRGLVGHWELYRPSWFEGADDYFIISHLDIEFVNGVCIFAEKQNYTHEHVPVLADDVGPIIFFAKGIAALTKSTDSICMKLYSFQDLNPPPGRSADGVRECFVMKGHYLAISDRGRKPSAPIYARRVKKIRRRESDHITRSELYCEDLKPAFEYFSEFGYS